MAEVHVPFDKRLKRIVRRHERMANGVVHSVNADGLIIARPRIYKPKFPLRGIVTLVAIGFLFKGLLFSYLGAEVYADKLTALENGTVIEQAGAWVMQPDIATTFIAGQINLITR